MTEITICTINGVRWILGEKSQKELTWNEAVAWCESIGQELPPREVLLMAYLNPEKRGGFAGNYYWSSTEYNSDFAWVQNFYYGTQGNNGKDGALPVRAVMGIKVTQPEPEPVAWMWTNKELGGTYFSNSGDSDHNWKPLFTSPPEREPLSCKMVSDFLKSFNEEVSHEYRQGFEDGVEWAEAAHGIGGGE